MTIFIVQIILVLSLGAVVFLSARALPRLPEEEKNGAEKPKSWTIALEKKLPLARLDGAVHSLLEKILRKTKLILMRFDNSVNQGLSRLKDSAPVKNGESPASEHLEALNEVKGKSPPGA